MRLVLLVVILHACLAASAQRSDILSVQMKNGRIIKNFGAGSSIHFINTSGQELQSQILWIRNDTIALYNYELLNSGGADGRRDTMSFFTFIHYKEVERVRLYQHRGYLRNRIASILMVGSAGYFSLNVVNGLYLKQSLDDRKYLQTLLFSAGVFGAALLVKKPHASFSKKRHRIVYVSLNN